MFGKEDSQKGDDSDDPEQAHMDQVEDQAQPPAPEEEIPAHEVTAPEVCTRLCCTCVCAVPACCARLMEAMF